MELDWCVRRGSVTLSYMNFREVAEGGLGTWAASELLPRVREKFSLSTYLAVPVLTPSRKLETQLSELGVEWCLADMGSKKTGAGRLSPMRTL